MTITRGQMQRELYGVGSLVGREKFGLGSSLKKFVRKIIPNEVAEVAVKAAPFVAPFNPLLAGSMSALGTFDQSGSIGRSVKSGLINYGLGQGARYLGGAGFQEGFNPFAGGNYGFSSPLGTDTGIGKLLADKGYIGQTTGPQTFDDKFTSIEDVLYETSPDKLSIAQKAGIAFDKNVAQTATPGFKESVSKLLSGDFTTMGEGLKEIGGKTLKTIYTDKDGNIDKLAIGATIAGGTNYLEARKLAKEADLVVDEDEYTEEMYEADRARYKEYYSDILTPESFGLKDGGRVKYAEGGLSKNRIAQLMSLLESGEIDEDYKKQIKEEIDQLMGKYKSGGRVKFLKGGDTEYNAMVTEMYIKAGGQEGTGMDIDTFAETYFSKFAKGGRAELNVGGVPSITLQEKEEIVEPDASMMVDTTTSNPIPENAAELAAAEIAKVIMGTRGIPGEETEGVMSSTEFIFNEYVMPKRKQLMDDYGLSLNEADDLIRSAMDKYKKADGGRVELKFGSEPEEKEMGIMSLDIEEKEDDEDMLMAGGPISFSRQEKSYLFRKLAGGGGSSRSYTMPQLYGILNNPNSPANINDAKVLKEIAIVGLSGKYKKGGRVEYAMGSEVPVRQNQGGITELDYRNTGGFVPIGVKEKADDVPAMLSKNEFVFTADAVRNAGGGDINKGAQKMYSLMKSLENKVVV
jgi:hypothetical protein